MIAIGTRKVAPSWHSFTAQAHVMRNLFVVFACVALAGVSLVGIAQTAPGTTEAGVSEALARWRKATIDSIIYTLHFSIPDDTAIHITAVATVDFRLSNTSAPVQLDFQQPDDAIDSFSLNGKTLDRLVDNEHLLLPRNQLRSGWNRATVAFRLRRSAINRRPDLAYTLLVPAKARTVYPCFDQPDLKARYKLSLDLPKGWTGIGNAGIADSAIVGNRVRLRFDTSDLFSTYLFSFVAGKDFAHEVRTLRGMPVGLYYQTRDSLTLGSRDSIFRIAGDALAFMEDSISGTRFPFQKLDLIDINNFQYGGMEHVGAIDLSRSVIFLNANAEASKLLQRASTIGHEISHMWFGDLVTMRWFDDVWIKEVFANYMAARFTKQGGERYNLAFLQQYPPAAYTIDRTYGANAIYQPLGNLNDAGLMYGNIIYNKSPVFMRQLEARIGWNALREGLRVYLQRYAYGNVSWNELIGILERTSGKPLQEWNRQWVDTPGRPVVSFELKNANGRIASLRVSQKGEHDIGHILEQRFAVSRVYRDRVVTDTIELGRDVYEIKSAAGAATPDFILLNSDGFGYGRFAVDTGMHSVARLRSPVMRLSAYINRFENMLAGEGLDAPLLLGWYLDALSGEQNDLNIGYLCRQIRFIYWKLLSPQMRRRSARSLEEALWTAYGNLKEERSKKAVFDAYADIATTGRAISRLAKIWKERSIRLNETEELELACELMLKGVPEDSVYQEQRSRLSPSNIAKLDFLRRAVSADVAVRDSFARSLEDLSVRRNESWVKAGLAYFHHPLHADESVRYLPRILELLETVHTTGDIFFPYAWLANSLGQYARYDVLDIAQTYRMLHPPASDRQRKLDAMLRQVTGSVEMAVGAVERGMRGVPKSGGLR